MRARRGLCGAARQRRVVKEPQFMNSEFTTQLWCLDALLSRGPGERPGPGPGPFRAPRPPHNAVAEPLKQNRRTIMRTIRISGPRARANWGIGPHGSHTRRTPHPTRQAHGRHGPRGRSPDRRPPHPAAIISRCSATASGDARHCRCRGATPDTPRSAYRARGPGSRGSLGTSRIYPPAQPPQAPSPAPLSSRRESDNHPLRSHFHSRLRSVL